MCEFCQGRYGSELLIRDKKSVVINVAKSRLDLVEETPDGYGLFTYDSQKINYCPVCGRKLEEQNDNNQNE